MCGAGARRRHIDCGHRAAGADQKLHQLRGDPGQAGAARLLCVGAQELHATPLPVVRVIEAPKSGMLTVRRGELKTDQVAGCPGLKIPAQVVFYQARVGATGSDHLVYEVTTPTGEVTTRRGRARVFPR